MTTDVQEAMVLSPQEWEDIGHMLDHYERCTRWVDLPAPRGHDHAPEHVEAIRRRRDLARRVVSVA